MKLKIPNRFVDGQTVNAADLNANFNEINAIVNGELDDFNFHENASIDNTYKQEANNFAAKVKPAYTISCLHFFFSRLQNTVPNDSGYTPGGKRDRINGSPFFDSGGNELTDFIEATVIVPNEFLLYRIYGWCRLKNCVAGIWTFKFYIKRNALLSGGEPTSRWEALNDSLSGGINNSDIILSAADCPFFRVSGTDWLAGYGNKIPSGAQLGVTVSMTGQCAPFTDEIADVNLWLYGFCPLQA